jgi:hypothetical protein
MSLPGVPSEYAFEVKIAEGDSDPNLKLIAENRAVSSGYFSTVRIPLLAGEICSDNPDRPGVVVNRAFAALAFGANANAVGHHVVGGGILRSAVITGLVGDAREIGLDRQPVPTVYWCYKVAQPGARFLLRSSLDPKTLGETLRRKIHEIEPRRSVFNVIPLENHISDAYVQNKLRTVLLSFFALTAVSLSCVGLYGTLSYLVNVRRREVGLRLALGAVRSRILTHFLWQGLAISLAGCTAGLVLSLFSSQLLAGMLFGVSPNDITTLSAVVVLIFVTALIASVLPAARACRLHPMQVLRDQ